MTLVAKHLGFRSRRKTLLEDIQLAIHPGQLTAVLGPNGAGKSTLLRLLAGELLPSEGSVHLNGQPWQQWPREEIARTLAVLPQSSSLSFGFTGLEVVLMGRIPHSTGLKRDLEIARACLQETDSLHLSERPFPLLSGGEQQRVQLARVLAQIQSDSPHPRYLLLDEPTAALDPAHQQLTMKVARSYADRGVGVMVILHDLNLAARYADRVLLLQAGRSIAEGPTDEVLETKRLSALFELPMQVMEHPSGAFKLVLTL